ncbi:OLC1v1024325C1 [Oldenlandia corymbosa var. corymbosa]|uniref:OLC1v1024325C1 n=1 Tax=Oldenlandia corymbosa var. corymbosa TaxID=529605 RepID=A0AAV1C2J8_OLDCO|nr:OLC1v1024325C1 [Oldenlandia corymbosa var. corymbosa]
MENYNYGYGDAPYYGYDSEYGDYPTYQEDPYSWNNSSSNSYSSCDYQGYSFDAGYNSGFGSAYMSPNMLSCLERIDKLLDDIEKKNASYFSQEDCYHSNASVYQLPPPKPTLRELAARRPTLRELVARQPTLRELAALQSSPCQPTMRELASLYQQPPAQPQLSVREAALRDWQSEKGQQLIKEVNQYRMSVGLPEYDPIGNLLKLNKNEKISADDSLVQSPQPPSQTELECEELEETEEITSPDIPSSPDSSGIYIVVKHDSLILRVGDKNVDQVDFDENNIPIVSKEGFEVDTCGEVVPGIRDFEDDVKNGSMKDQEEDQWYKIEFEKEDVVVLEYKFIFSHRKENHYKRFIVAVEHGFFWYRDGKFVGGVLADASEVWLNLMREKGRAFNVDASPLRGEELATISGESSGPDFGVIMENYNYGYGDAPYYGYDSEYGDYPTYQEDPYSWNNSSSNSYSSCDYQGYSFDAGYNSGFGSAYMSPNMLSCLERIDKLLDDIEKKNASYFSQEDCYHSNASVYQLPPPKPTLRELAARRPTLRELVARQPTLRELAALQSSPCQPTMRELASLYQQPPAQPQLSVREAALRDWQSEKGQQLIKEVNQYRMSVGLPEYDPIGNLLKLNKNEKISADDSLVQSPQPPSQTELECEELEETEEITSPDIPSSPDSSGIYIVVKHDSLILRVGDKNVDQVDFDENNIPIVSKEGFEVDTCGEVVPGIRDFEDDVKNGSMKDQEEDQWYKIEFEKEDVVVLEYKFIFSHRKENHYKRFIVAVEHGFFWYRDGYSD